MMEPTTAVTSRVTIVDVDLPMRSIVWLMVKWAIAAVPALLILSVIGFVVSVFFVGLLSALSGGGR